MRRRRCVVAVLLAGLTTACCTISRGRTQLVPITSNPPGAQVRIEPGGQLLTTPGTAVLARKTSHVVTLQANGYASQSITLKSSASSALLGNVVWIHPLGWVIGLGVDLGTGAGYDLEPEQVAATLTPAATSK